MRTAISLILLCLATCAMSQTPIAHYQKGDSLAARGLYGAAIQELGLAEKDEGKLLRNRRQLLYGRLAYAHQQLGEYRKALGYYEKQLGMMGPSSPSRDGIMLNMTDLYLLTGEYRKVIAVLGKLPGDNAKKTINMASALCRMGKTDDALKLLDEVATRTAPCATAIMRQANVAALQNKAFVLDMTGRHAEAYLLMKAVLPRLETKEEYYQALGNFALTESALGKSGDALGHIDQCIAWQKTRLGKNHDDVAISTRKKAEILMAAGKTAKAEKAFKEFFGIERQNIEKNFAFMTEKQRRDYWNSKKDLIAECHALGSQNPRFLFDVAVFSKSVLLQSNKDFYRLVSTDKRLKTEYERLLVLRSKAANLSGPRRDSMEIAMERKERELMGKLPVWQGFSRQMSVTGGDIARALTRPTDRAVEFVRVNRGDTTLYAALMIDPQGKATYITIDTEQGLYEHALHGNASLGTLREAMESHRHSDKDNIYTDTLLGRKIWTRVMKNVPRKGRLFFAADGLFHLLAIEYLNFDRPDCELYRVSSTRYLLERRKGGNAPTLLLLGGIDYNDAALAKRQYSPDRSTSQMLAEDRMPPAVGGGYGYLPGSLAEVDAIASTYKRGTVTKLTRRQCDEAAVKAMMGRYGIVHVSTHGYSTDNEAPTPAEYDKDRLREDLSMRRCGVLLSGANTLSLPNDSNRHHEDGVLSAQEISDLDLSHVDLAVLSACQTGLGHVTSDGVFGMPRGLKKANAGTVVVSLWEVSDKATQLLMCHFYQNMERGMGKRAALAKAQRQLRETALTEKETYGVFDPTTGATRQEEHVVRTTFDKPHLWAAFILIDGI